jgi:hypothetical protein
MPLKYAVEARRFRPGLDYTLATSEGNEARLDVVLGLTPPVRDPADSSDEDDDPPTRGRSRRKLGKEANRGWVMGEWGGWECYMAPHNEEDDPAVYRSSEHKNGHGAEASRTAPNGRHVETSKSKHMELDSSSFRSPSPALSSSNSTPGNDASMDEFSDGSEVEDSTLLTVQPGYNRLLLVLRDERVMRFVKYVSAAAEGSRWDVCGEYEVGMLEEQDG